MGRKNNLPALPVTRPEIVLVEPDEDELPNKDMMTTLDIPVTQWGDFIKAWRFMLYTSQGLNISQAAKAAGLARRNVYEEHWQILFSKVQRQMLGKYAAHVVAGTNRVFEMWSEMIDRVTFDVMSATTEPGDRVKAMEFLYMAVVSQKSSEKRDDSVEKEYLRSNPSFNPQAPIQVLGDLNLTIQGQPNEQVDTTRPSLLSDVDRRDFVDIKATDTD